MVQMKRALRKKEDEKWRKAFAFALNFVMFSTEFNKVSKVAREIASVKNKDEKEISNWLYGITNNRSKPTVTLFQMLYDTFPSQKLYEVISETVPITASENGTQQTVNGIAVHPEVVKKINGLEQTQQELKTQLAQSGNVESGLRKHIAELQSIIDSQALQLKQLARGKEAVKLDRGQIIQQMKKLGMEVRTRDSTAQLNKKLQAHLQQQA